MKIILRTPLLIFTLIAIACSVQSEPVPKQSEPTKYEVGFKAIYTFDESRDYQINETTEFSKGRPLRIFYWYPSTSQAPDSEVLTIKDFIYSEPQDPQYQPYYELLNDSDMKSLERKIFMEGVTGDPIKEILERPGNAREGLDFDGKRYPLVLYIMGRNNHQIENLMLWEYLASHGYCVAVVVQQGPSGLNNRIEFNAENIYAQLKDAQFTLDLISEFPNVDPNKISVMGHSSGALQAMLLKLENENIQCVVSLDGSINTNDGVEILEDSEYDFGSLSMDILNLYNPNKRSLNNTVLHQMDRQSQSDIAFNKSIHHDFQMFPIYCSISGTMFPGISEIRDIETGVVNYKTMLKIVRYYLDFQLANKLDEEEYKSHLVSLELANNDLITVN